MLISFSKFKNMPRTGICDTLDPWHSKYFEFSVKISRRAGIYIKAVYKIITFD
jgi:hypothetical protein